MMDAIDHLVHEVMPPNTLGIICMDAYGNTTSNYNTKGFLVTSTDSDKYHL